MREYEKLLINYKTQLNIMKDNIKDYLESPSTETFYPLVEDVADLPLMREKLVKHLPRRLLESIMGDLEKTEQEVIQLLEKADKNLATYLATSLNVHASSSLAGERG